MGSELNEAAKILIDRGFVVSSTKPTVSGIWYEKLWMVKESHGELVKLQNPLAPDEVFYFTSEKYAKQYLDHYDKKRADRSRRLELIDVRLIS